MTSNYSLNRRRNCCPRKLHMLSMWSTHIHQRVSRESVAHRSMNTQCIHILNWTQAKLFQHTAAATRLPHALHSQTCWEKCLRWAVCLSDRAQGRYLIHSNSSQRHLYSVTCCCCIVLIWHRRLWSTSSSGALFACLVLFTSSLKDGKNNLIRNFTQQLFYSWKYSTVEPLYNRHHWDPTFCPL